MCYPFFFLLRFCFHAPWFESPWGNMFYLIKPAPGFFFNFIRNPRGYQYIGTSPFSDSFRFAKSHTNPKHHRDWKTQTSSTKYWSRPRRYSILGTPILKIVATIGLQQLHGPAKSSIELLSLSSTQQQSVTRVGWKSVLFSVSHRSSKQKPKKIYFLFHENPNSKKKTFRINIITIISKPSIKSSVNGFRQIS